MRCRFQPDFNVFLLANEVLRVSLSLLLNRLKCVVDVAETVEDGAAGKKPDANW